MVVLLLAAASLAALAGIFYVAFLGSDRAPQSAAERDLLIAEGIAEEQPESAGTALRVAWAAYELGQLDKALRNVEKSERLQPGVESAETYLLKGLIYEADEQNEAARQAYQRAAELEQRSSIDALLRLSSLEIELGRLDEAEKHALEALRLKETDVGIITNVARVQAAKGQKEQARESLLSALRYLSDASELEDELASLEYGPADYDRARQAWLEGRAEDAEALMRQAIERSPEIAWLHVAWGDFLLEKGDVTGARAAYEQALRVDPDDEEAREALESL
jgi:tetratricopeptide (TPR) repeat protein